VNPDPYDVLGVTREASEHEIRAAYRRRVRDAHPDQGGSDEEFIAVRGAYEAIRHGRTGYATRATHDPGADLRHAQAVWAQRQAAARTKPPETKRIPVVLFRRPRRGVWYLGAVTTFVALLFTCLGRGYGLLPHEHLGSGKYLVLGNFVTNNAAWAKSTGLWHLDMIKDVLVLGLYSLAYALPWLLRSVIAVPVRWREYTIVGLVIGCTATLTDGVLSQLTFPIYLGGIMIWTAACVVMLTRRVLTA
jgi:hypothetical protein